MDALLTTCEVAESLLPSAAALGTCIRRAIIVNLPVPDLNLSNVGLAVAVAPVKSEWRVFKYQAAQ